MTRATDDIFDNVHLLTAELLKQQLEEFKRKKEMPPPAFLAQAIKFLKDNGIDSPARAKEVADKLAPHMPDFGPEDAVDGVPH